LLDAKGYLCSDDYLVKAVGLMKEKVNFGKEIIEKGEFLFKAPTKYDENVVAKKWKDGVPDFVKKYSDAIANSEAYNAAFLEETFKTMATEAGLNPGQLMQPLRVALSGEAGGPPIFEMLELLGKDEVKARLEKAGNQLRNTN